MAHAQTRGEENENCSLITTKASFPLVLRILCGILKNVNDFARRKDGTFNRGLMNFVEYKVPADHKPNRGVYTKDVVIDTQTGVWVRIFVPEQVAGLKSREDELLPIVFYFHGGGFATLSPDFLLYDVFCRRVARRRRVIVVSVDYRRAPEHRYPIAYDDSFEAVKWVSAEGRDNLPANADLSTCFLMGDSAGANIVHHLGCRIAASSEEISPVKIVGHVLIQPFFGGVERVPSELRLAGAPIVSMDNSDWHWKAFLPECANRDHPAANVFGPNAPDISGLPLPASLVVVGGHDPLQDWQLRLLRLVCLSLNLLETICEGEAFCNVVINNMWSIWKQSNKEQGQRVNMLILDNDWWPHGDYLLSCTWPIMSMIHFTDMDQPCMGDIYDSIDYMIER